MESLNQHIIFLLGGLVGLCSILMAFYKHKDSEAYRYEDYFMLSLLKYFLLSSLFVIICSSIYLILFNSIPLIVENFFLIVGFLMVVGFVGYVLYWSFTATMDKFPAWLGSKDGYSEYYGVLELYGKIFAVFWMYVIFCLCIFPLVHYFSHLIGLENHQMFIHLFSGLSEDFNFLHSVSFFDFGLGPNFIFYVTVPVLIFATLISIFIEE